MRPVRRALYFIVPQTVVGKKERAIKPLFVIIATSGRKQLLERTLDSLSQCRLPRRYRGTVLVENGTGPSLAGISARYPRLRIHYFHEPIANKSRALNRAVRFVLEKTRDSYVLFTDDDVRFDPMWLTTYERSFRHLRCFDFLGGEVRPDYVNGSPPQWIQPHLPWSAKGFCHPFKRPTVVPKASFLGANWGARALAIQSAGGFNVMIGNGGEYGSTGDEDEMQRRLRQAGGRGIYLPKALVWHYVNRQRSNLRWLLHRRYRDGLYYGLGLSDRKIPKAGFTLRHGLNHIGGVASDFRRGRLFDRSRALVSLLDFFQLLGIMHAKVRAPRRPTSALEAP